MFRYFVARRFEADIDGCNGVYYLTWNPSSRWNWTKDVHKAIPSYLRDEANHLALAADVTGFFNQSPIGRESTCLPIR